ncbi:hypothetical protein HII13_001638 [Brettanomyces bruxellensis]|nr:hypothetical protein HII13_001638 [Brettanomyces bruxellensis]
MSALETPQKAQVSVSEQSHVYPVNPESTEIQESKFIQNNKYLKNEHQFTYYNVPGANYAGPSQLKRYQLAFESGIGDEVDFCLNSLIGNSFTHGKEINLKKEYSFLTEYLIYYLNCQTFNPCAENKDMDKSLGSALILRNLAQDIDNSQVISMNMQIRDVILSILQNPIILQDEFSDPHYEQCKELLRYTMDIVEAISSYLAPVPAEDPLFMSLISLLRTVEDRSTITTIFRSMSRMMYNSKKEGDAPDSIEDDVLDTVVSFLALSIDSQNDSDELILTSLDFLYQFIQHSRVDRLLSSFERAQVLGTFLPKLLVFKLDYKTELTQPLPMLQLIQRLIASLNKLPEPDRATAWIRCAFAADLGGDVTQISLWRCYETQFAPFIGTQNLKLLPAVDFIKNVQHAFPRSSAMVITLDNGTKKFIIKGIRPRVAAVGIEQGRNDALVSGASITSRGNWAKYSKMKDSIQEPYKLFQYNANSHLQLNEINTSASLLLKQMDDLIDKLLLVPNLLPYIYDVLKRLPY